jgi:hypothetical protein
VLQRPSKQGKKTIEETDGGGDGFWFSEGAHGYKSWTEPEPIRKDPRISSVPGFVVLLPLLDL